VDVSRRQPRVNKAGRPSTEEGSPAERSNGRSVWLNGLFIVLGAAIAALSGVIGPLVLQSREEKREDRVEDQRAVGAARLLLGEFRQSAEQMAVLANDRITRRFDPAYRINISNDDLGLIASKLDGEEWGLVLGARSAVESLETFVNSQIERGSEVLTKGEAC